MAIPTIFINLPSSLPIFVAAPFWSRNPLHPNRSEIQRRGLSTPLHVSTCLDHLRSTHVVRSARIC